MVIIPILRASQREFGRMDVLCGLAAQLIAHTLKLNMSKVE